MNPATLESLKAHLVYVDCQIVMARDGRKASPVMAAVVRGLNMRRKQIITDLERA
jgi:hypothetical protein